MFKHKFRNIKETIMSRNMELAKIAKEIKEIKTMLNKSAMDVGHTTFDAERALFWSNQYKIFEKKWQMLERKSKHNLSFSSFEVKEKYSYSNTLEIAFEIIGDVEEFAGEYFVGTDIKNLVMEDIRDAIDATFGSWEVVNVDDDSIRSIQIDNKDGEISGYFTAQVDLGKMD